MIGNINIITKKLANKTGKPLEYYQDLSKYLFKKIEWELKENLEGGLFIRDVGTWSINGVKLRWFIYKTIRHIREHEDDGSIKSKNILEKEYHRLRLLLKLRNKMAKYYYEHKKPYELNKRDAKWEKAKEHTIRLEQSFIQDQARLSAEEVRGVF